ncbi:hypothetical protein BC936DRAFT_140742 [Jimgerdemannia flammicorona]|uniref:Uncharacterized protein n=1 Tax=Jimgerdemannia flammicorona TaxID=994334 RepID=A0A433AAQ9_9FUNG|nr:hypothetical protein BC936DRAFT_140742 [Jimgerdemannia flammicorona]
MATSITFKSINLTDKVKLNADLHPHSPLKPAYPDFHLLHHSTNTPLQPNAPKPRVVLPNRHVAHGLVQAIFHAYNNHQTLCLSPDDVWLAIAQGVSTHVNKHAEKLRHLFVEHKGKKNITVKVDDLRRSDTFLDWPKACDLLAGEVKNHIKVPELPSLLSCDFTTSTVDTVASSRIVLLETLKEYFSYKMIFECGIPRVVLLGTSADWQHLRSKYQELRAFNGLDLDVWFNRLDPVVENLLATYDGLPDEGFWASCATSKQYGSGGQRAYTGWITALFPYDKSGNMLHSNNLEADEVPNGLADATLPSLEEVVVAPVVGWARVFQNMN